MVWVGMELGLKLQYFEGNLWEMVRSTLHWCQRGTGLALPHLKGNVSLSMSSIGSSIMIKLKDEYNLTQHPWRFIAFLLCSTTIHSFFFSYTTVLGPQELPVPPCSGR